MVALAVASSCREVLHPEGESKLAVVRVAARRTTVAALPENKARLPGDARTLPQPNKLNVEQDAT